MTASNALYGNRQEDSSNAEQDELATTNLDLAAKAAARIGAVVLIEPVSGAPRYPLRTAADALAVIDRVVAYGSADNLRLLLDIDHLAVNGDDVTAVIAAHAARVGHVQIADAPGRYEPGSGGLEIGRQSNALEGAGHAGWVGLEYLPRATTAAGLAWLPVTAGAAQPGPEPAPVPRFSAHRFSSSRTQEVYDNRRVHRTGHHGRADGRPSR